MKRNTSQSNHSNSSATHNFCAIRWGTALEKRLVKFELPALVHALHIAVECSDDEFSPIAKKLNNAHRNPHPFVDISFPFDMPAICDAYEDHFEEVVDKAEGDPEYLPKFSGYVSAIVLSKLWRLCDTLAGKATPNLSPETVREITSICHLADQALRLGHSEERADAARLQLSQKINRRKKWSFKKDQHARQKLYAKTAARFLEWCSHERRFHGSIENTVIAASETQVFPYDYLECFQMLRDYDCGKLP